MTSVARLLVLVVFFAVMPVFAFADCPHSGDHVVLYGTTDDPDVFAWDSRFRMRDYAGGSFDRAQALLPHAVLVAPGTRAIVIACMPDFVQSKFSSKPDDAVGVIIVSGRYRGLARWVLAQDVRGILRPITMRR